MQPNTEDNKNSPGQPSTNEPLLPPSALGKRKTIQPASTNLEASSPAVSTHVPIAPLPEPAIPPPAASPMPVEPPQRPAEDTYVSPNTAAFMTGSEYQMQLEHKHLPIGIYIIAAFNALGFVVGFFDTSQSSILYVGLMLVNLLIAIGLLLRMEGARKIMVGVAVFSTVATLLTVVGFILLQARVNQTIANNNSVMAKIDQNRLTDRQKQQVATMKDQVTKDKKAFGKAITFTYVKLGVTAVESAAVIVYLTRPKIKEVFETSALA